ncbi:hypothetical protein E2C01_021649 [Portunus trituberculatus]|uniref:Uncharacterized protein n=1 Tax=Portunus trituberculatus TaxID=210409 RepID=A0A5B7E593_PORTR|nr:hypothetical protein [Portunus trituberculatus]
MKSWPPLFPQRALMCSIHGIHESLPCPSLAYARSARKGRPAAPRPVVYRNVPLPPVSAMQRAHLAPLAASIMYILYHLSAKRHFCSFNLISYSIKFVQVMRGLQREVYRHMWPTQVQVRSTA